MTDDFIVEQPQESDFDALRGLFVSTLEPHYDGDHDAHLTRLINAHRANGQDANASTLSPNWDMSPDKSLEAARSVTSTSRSSVTALPRSAH